MLNPQTTRHPQLATNLELKKESRPMSFLVVAASIPQHKVKREEDYKVSKAQLQSRPMHTLGDQRKISMPKIMVTWNLLPRTLCASLASLLVTTWKILHKSWVRVLLSCRVRFERILMDRNCGQSCMLYHKLIIACDLLNENTRNCISHSDCLIPDTSEKVVHVTSST